MIEIVYSTPEHIAAVEGPQRKTVRALSALLDGKLQGVAGYTIESGRAIAFSKIVGKLPPQTIMKVARRVLDMAAETGLPVIALPDPAIPGSRRFLERLGFKFSEET